MAHITERSFQTKNKYIMVKSTISLFLLFLLFFLSNSVFSQNKLDTLNVIVKSFKKHEGYPFKFQIYIILKNDKLLKNRIEVHDSIILCLNPPKSEKLFLKIYKNRKRIFASGEWNEAGFLGIVTYYDRRGNIKKQSLFNHGEFINDL